MAIVLEVPSYHITSIPSAPKDCRLFASDGYSQCFHKNLLTEISPDLIKLISAYDPGGGTTGIMLPVISSNGLQALHDLVYTGRSVIPRKRMKQVLSQLKAIKVDITARESTYEDDDEGYSGGSSGANNNNTNNSDGINGGPSNLLRQEMEDDELYSMGIIEPSFVSKENGEPDILDEEGILEDADDDDEEDVEIDQDMTNNILESGENDEDEVEIGLDDDDGDDDDDDEIDDEEDEDQEDEDEETKGMLQDTKDIIRITRYIRKILPRASTFQTSPESFECFICFKSLCNSAVWANHLMAQHFYQNFTCPTCGKKFNYFNVFNQHLYKAHGYRTNNPFKESPGRRKSN